MKIDCQSFLFRIAAKEILLLPSYKGSTLRGGFGNAFRRVVCALRKNECDDCILKEKCVYSYVFETPPPSDTKMMRKYKAAPHPFIIEPPPEKRRGYSPGSEITFGLTLIGRAVDYLPYFIYTFDELGKIGLGKGKGKFELRDVSCEGEKIYDSRTKTLGSFPTSTLSLPMSPPAPGGRGLGGEGSTTLYSSVLTIHFLTPTRILYDGDLTLDLEFHVLVRNLLRRLSLLYYFHCNGDPSGWDFKGMIEKAKEVKVKKRNLRWYDWERYSARQETRVNMGGVVGEITFEGNIGPFMSLLNAGEALHVGKGTGFGLGRYKIQDSKFNIQE
ncbi:MAG: CRISPR system precrRNA processing endoribonuclease RAMP protein Cas6 [Nitrospirae bacterium]|nr:CRISPR system precrRNA processing endoribonuclease RAMP protein Cas6 [Nitrospirota bacterium]